MGTAVGAGVIAVISYFANMRRASIQLEVVPTASIHSVSVTGLIIRVDALLKNPTGASFVVKFPYVKISHKDTVLGSSQVIDKDISVPAYGQVKIDNIQVEVSTFSFFSVAYDVIKAILNKESVTMKIETITTIDLGWSRVPYNDQKEVTLKK